MKFVTLTIIASCEYEDALKAVAKKAGASGATVIQAKGSGIQEAKSFFSLTFEGNHTMLLYILEENLSKHVLKAIKAHIKAGKSDAIAYTSPIGHIVGLNENILEKFNQTIKEEEQRP